MKRFIYFEQTEGGMDCFELLNETALHNLVGWMTDMCKHDDSLLLNWMSKAEVGEYTKHRLGYLVRLKNL